jgi:hypothetical protein
LLNSSSPSEVFAKKYYAEAAHTLNWIKKFRDAQKN